MHEDQIAPGPPRGPTILVVDNDPALRVLIVRYLARCGYRVLEARLAPEALALAQQPRELIDVLLTDVMMPGMNGFELAKAFAGFHPETKVLYMSGRLPDAIRETLEAHHAMFLAKPFQPEALLEKIRSVLQEVGPSDP